MSKEENEHGECNCGNDGKEPHTCPYKEEITGSKKLCNCCAECKSRCAQEI